SRVMVAARRFSSRTLPTTDRTPGPATREGVTSRETISSKGTGLSPWCCFSSSIVMTRLPRKPPPPVTTMSISSPSLINAPVPGLFAAEQLGDLDSRQGACPAVLEKEGQLRRHLQLFGSVDG